jgi:hypothetical protein
MSPFVVAAFADRAAARAAAESVAASGIDGLEVQVHEGAAPVSNSGAIDLDELVTGGMIGNFAELLDNLLQTRPAETTARTYDEKVRHEGTIVSVRVRSADDAERVRAALEAGGAERVARLPQPGLES